MSVIVEKALLLTGNDIAIVAYAVRLAQESRKRNGLPRARALDDLAAAVTALTSATGQSDMPDASGGDTDYVDIETAAGLLGCSTRQARRLAPRLGGRLVGGRWLVDRLAVAEHIEGGRRDR